MAPKKAPPQGEAAAAEVDVAAAEANAALLAAQEDAERIRQAADEALWVESAEEGMEEAMETMWPADEESEAAALDDEDEDEEGPALAAPDELSEPYLPESHDMINLQQVADMVEAELADPLAFPALHPEFNEDVTQEGTLEWKCVYGRKGAKYEGTLSVYRGQNIFGTNQPEGATEDSEDAEIRVKNEQNSALVYNLVYREYIDGRGVHQDLWGDQYAGEWFGGLRQGHGTQTWINREHMRTVDDVDLYQTEIQNKRTNKLMKGRMKDKTGIAAWQQEQHPFYTGKPRLAYLHDKSEEPGWIRPEDGELRGKHGVFPDVYQWTTADNLVGTYSGQWYRDAPEGCGVMVWSDGTSLAGEWRRGAWIGNFPVCTAQESDFHMRLGQLSAQKAKMFQYKPQDMTVIHEKPHLWQHPYFYDDGDQWRAPGPIHKYYEVPPEYKARVERMDAEREAWLDGWKNAGKEHPDWQQQWTAIEAVEQQKLVQVNFGEPSPLMELAEQAQRTDNDDVHEQLRLSAAARGAYIPSVRELRELVPGRDLGPGQLLAQLAQGHSMPLSMEDIEATVQFVDKYGEEGLIGVDDQTKNGQTQPMTVERARELLLEAIPDALIRESRNTHEEFKSLKPPAVNLLRLETQPMRAPPDKDSPEYAQRVKERVLRRSEEALQELNDQLQAALRLKRLRGLPIELDEQQRDYLRKVKDEYQLRLNAIRERRLHAVAVEEVPAQEGNMGGLDLSDVERKARLEELQHGRERAVVPGEEEVVTEREPLSAQERDDRKAIQALAGRSDEPNVLLLPGMTTDELKRTQKHAQRFYNLEMDATEKLLEFSRLLENYSRVPDDAPLDRPSTERPPLLPAHAPGQVLNPLPPVNTPAQAAEAIRSKAYQAGFAPLKSVNKLLDVLPWRKKKKQQAEAPPAAVDAYAEYLEELPVRSKLEWTADAAPRVAVGPEGEVIEAEDSFQYRDSLQRLRAERAQLAEEIRREQDALLEMEASTYAFNVLDLARREAAELQATKLDSRFWGDQTDEDKNTPIQEWEPTPIGKTEEELLEASRSIREEIEQRLQAAYDAEEDAQFDAVFDREENQERMELKEALERKRAALQPDKQLDKMLQDSVFSKPGSLIEVELAVDEANVGDAMPIKAAPGAEPYSERVKATLSELRDIELERAREAAERTREMEEGEEEEEDEDAAIEAEARLQIEGQSGEDESLKRLELLERKIIDGKWERFWQEEKEANKAFRLVGATYEPLLMAQRRLIAALRNRQFTLDTRLENLLADFFAKYEAQYGPGEEQQAQVFDKWLAKWVDAEMQKDAEALDSLAERNSPPVPKGVDGLALPAPLADCPPVLKDFLAKLSQLEKQRDAEAERAQQEWEKSHVLALPAPDVIPPIPKPQKVPSLVISEGLDASDIAQKRARELLSQLQTERIEAEVTRQLRSEIAAKDGGWDLGKAAIVLKSLAQERSKKRSAEWDRVLEDAFERGNLEKYPLLVQLERSAHEELGLHGVLPRGRILWAPLLRPSAPFSAASLVNNPRLPLPLRIGKEHLLQLDGSEEGASAWQAAANAYAGLLRPALPGTTSTEVAGTEGAGRAAAAQSTLAALEARDMKMAPGSDSLEYVYALKSDVEEDEGAMEAAWRPDMSIYSQPEAVKQLVQAQVKQLAQDTPAPSELPPPGAVTNFEAAVEERKKQVLKNLLKRYQPKAYEDLPQGLQDPPELWRPGENEFTASVAEVNRFLDSVRAPKDLQTTIASLRRVVAAQQEFEHIVERGQSLMASAERRFVSEFLVPKAAELRAVESQLWKDGLLFSYEQPELVRYWKTEWEAREALQAGLAGVLARPDAQGIQKEREKVDKQLDRWHKKLDETLSEVQERKEDDRASAAERLSDAEYVAPATDYNGRPVLTGAPEEVGANAEEEWELAYEEMERRDGNTDIHNERDERDEQFFQDGLRKARDAIRKLGGSGGMSEDLANFTRSLFKDDLELARELLTEEDEEADREELSMVAKDDDEEYEYEEVEVEEGEEGEDIPETEGDFWESMRAQLKGASPADLDKAAKKPHALRLKDVLPTETESRIVAQVEAERPGSKETAVLWNMTEDDETQIDIFTVAPDGKFSKYDTDRLKFLPYADLDQLKVNPAMVRPRPGSKEAEELEEMEEERKEAEEREREARRLRGEFDDLPASKLEVDEYGFAVVKSGLEEEEQEEQVSGEEWKRQPWFSDEHFWDFLEIPKAAPELTQAHEKEFLLEGKPWMEAANTPWIGDEGEITDMETKKLRVDAAVAALKAGGVRMDAWKTDTGRIDFMLADDTSEVEQEMMQAATFKDDETGLTFMAFRDKDGKLDLKEVPPPESPEQRAARMEREAEERAAEARRKELDSSADDYWTRVLKQEADKPVKLPESEWFSKEALAEEQMSEEDEEMLAKYIQETVVDDETGEAAEDDEDEDDDVDEAEAAEMEEVIRRINAGEFVPPRLPSFLGFLQKRLAPKPPPRELPPQDKTASISANALGVLPDYMDAVRWISSMSAQLQCRAPVVRKQGRKCPKASRGTKTAARGKRGRPAKGGCFSLAVPLGKWIVPEGR